VPTGEVRDEKMLGQEIGANGGGINVLILAMVF
jgi:hypothetical protein